MRNYDVYLERMEKSMQDKLFFLNHIDINSYDYVVDFGCANGELLSRLDIPDSKKVGVEKSEEMRKRFKKKLPNALIFSNIFSAWKYFNKMEQKKKVLVILSSVLHEIEEDERAMGLDWFIISQANTIVIRDMIKPEIKDVPNLENIVNSVINDSNPLVTYNWGIARGEIKNLAELSEFLLKMDYVENYDLEVKEKYFSGDVNIFQFVLEETMDTFKPTYKEDFTIPPMIEKQDKYGLPHFRTHRKLIMERVEKK